MDYMDLTDEEILQAIKIAREVSIENQLDFKEALFNSLERMNELNVTQDNEPTTQEEILPDETKEEKPETIQLDLSEISSITENFDEEYNYHVDYVQSFLDTYDALVAKSIQGGMSPSSIPDKRKEYRLLFESIKKGLYTPEELAEVVRDSGILFDTKMNQALSTKHIKSSNFFASLMLVNKMRRLGYYVYCKLCPDELMGQKQQFLIDSLKKATKKLKLIPTSKESGLDGIHEDFKAKYEEIRKKPDVGFERDSTSTFPWPKSYEPEVSFIDEFVRQLQFDVRYNNLTPPSMETIIDIEREINFRLYMYEIMSIDEFRENSIAKMKLSKDEKMEFERFLEKFKSKGYGGK